MKRIFAALAGLVGFLSLPQKTAAQDNGTRTYTLFLDQAHRRDLKTDIAALDSLARSGGRRYAAIETPVIDDSEEAEQFKYVFKKEAGGYTLTAYDSDDGVFLKDMHIYEFDEQLTTLRLTWYERINGAGYYPTADALSTSYAAALAALEDELADCARFMQYKYGFVFK